MTTPSIRLKSFHPAEGKHPILIFEAGEAKILINLDNHRGRDVRTGYEVFMHFLDNGRIMIVNNGMGSINFAREIISAGVVTLGDVMDLPEDSPFRKQLKTSLMEGLGYE